MEVKKSLFLIIALTLTACVDNYTLMTSAEEMWSNGGTTLTRATGDCTVGNDNQKLLFTQTAIGYTTVMTAFGQRYRPQNEVMVMLEVWNTDLTASKRYTAAYDSIDVSEDGSTLVAFAIVRTENKSIFSVTDIYNTVPSILRCVSNAQSWSKREEQATDRSTALSS